MIEKDLNKFRPYLKNCINNLKKSETWKAQLIIANNFVFSIDNDKEHKATINPINKKDNKCFKYAVTVMINYDVIKRDPQRITKIKPFINKYYWEKIDFPSGKDDWKKFEKIM